MRIESTLDLLTLQNHQASEFFTKAKISGGPQLIRHQLLRYQTAVKEKGLNLSEWIHCWGVPQAPGGSFPRRYMCTLEDKILDWKMPPVMGRSLHPGQFLVCPCAMSGLTPQLSQFATDREPAFGEDMRRSVGKAG